MMARVFIVDHYDSFTDLITYHFKNLGVDTCIVQYDDPILLTRLETFNATHIVLSPGPGHPSDMHQTLKLIQQTYLQYPILGVCLGMQCIAVAFGGHVISAHQVMHGKQSKIIHINQKCIFQSIPKTLQVTRYHSLMVDSLSLPKHLIPLAWTIHETPSTLMALRHFSRPIFGVQYHPEAIFSEFGALFFQNFCQDWS